MSTSEISNRGISVWFSKTRMDNWTLTVEIAALIVGHAASLLGCAP